jgi:hypothetical protein
MRTPEQMIKIRKMDPNSTENSGQSQPALEMAADTEDESPRAFAMVPAISVLYGNSQASVHPGRLVAFSQTTEVVALSLAA